MLAHILGRGSNSRLYRDAGGRQEARDATPAPATRAPRSIRPASASSARRSPASTLTELEAAIDGVIADVVENGVTAEELERAKTQLIADAIYAQDNQAHAGALVRRRADHRLDRRRRPRPGRTASAPSPPRRCAMPPQTWLDKRRSVTGYLVKDTAKLEEKRS